MKNSGNSDYECTERCTERFYLVLSILMSSRLISWRSPPEFPLPRHCVHTQVYVRLESCLQLLSSCGFRVLVTYGGVFASLRESKRERESQIRRSRCSLSLWGPLFTSFVMIRCRSSVKSDKGVVNLFWSMEYLFYRLTRSYYTLPYFPHRPTYRPTGHIRLLCETKSWLPISEISSNQGRVVDRGWSCWISPSVSVVTLCRNDHDLIHKGLLI